MSINPLAFEKISELCHNYRVSRTEPKIKRTKRGRPRKSESLEKINFETLDLSLSSVEDIQKKMKDYLGMPFDNLLYLASNSKSKSSLDNILLRIVVKLATHPNMSELAVYLSSCGFDTKRKKEISNSENEKIKLWEIITKKSRVADHKGGLSQTKLVRDVKKITKGDQSGNDT